MAEGLVYIVDDDDFLRSTLHSSLSCYGYEVKLFSSPFCFLEQVDNRNDACLILDVRMPGRSGLWLQDELQNKGIDIPVIFYTGNADVDIAVQVMSKGAFTLLKKPLNNDLLIEKVREAIDCGRKRAVWKQGVCDARNRLRLLTARERQIADLLSEGMTAPEIATRLYLSARTIEAHRVRIFAKLEVRSVAQLARLTTLALSA